MAAILLAQLEALAALTERRLAVWERYHGAFAAAEDGGLLRRPIVPPHCVHNGHLYYLLLRDRETRDRLIRALAECDIVAPFHYIPLHTSPAGQRYARSDGGLPNTDDVSGRLIRLPLYADITAEQVERVIEAVTVTLRR